MDPLNPNQGLVLDLAASKPGRQAEIVREQYKMLTDPNRRPQDYYRAFVAGAKAAAADAQPERVLDAVVAKVVGTPKARHYRALSDGFLGAWDRDSTLVPVHSTIFALNTVGMRVNPQLGVRDAAGDLSAVFLYLKDAPLSKDVAQPILFAMNEVMSAVLPTARPRILVVRSGEYLDIDKRTTPRSQTLRIAGLLGQWTAMWAEIAKAA